MGFIQVSDGVLGLDILKLLGRGFERRQGIRKVKALSRAHRRLLQRHLLGQKSKIGRLLGVVTWLTGEHAVPR